MVVIANQRGRDRRAEIRIGLETPDAAAPVYRSVAIAVLTFVMNHSSLLDGFLDESTFV